MLVSMLVVENNIIISLLSTYAAAAAAVLVVRTIDVNAYLVPLMWQWADSTIFWSVCVRSIRQSFENR